jgi:hypothetical protein
MIKKHTIALLTCLIFSVFILSFYSCSRSSDNSGKTETVNPTGSASTAPSASSNRSGEAGQGPNPEFKADNNGEKESANHPPAIDKARLQLESLNNRDIIKVVAGGTDKDNDAVTFEYEWFRNGEPAGNGDTLSGFKRGDKIVANVTPFDGKDYGAPKSLTLEISNTTPKITGYKEIKFDGNNYEGQIIASDPDDDTLVYSLKSAPSGMTVDPSKGQIKWNVPPDFKGEASFVVSVSDGHGGEISQNCTIKVEPQQK